MKQQPIFYALIAFLAIWMESCNQDLGPYKEVNRTYSQTNFDRLDIGSAFHVDVRSGSTFAINIRGNEADVNDLDLSVHNGVFHAEYRGTGRRQRYDTYFTITMPTLRGVSFSSAVQSTITGFANLTEVDVTLSGASKANLNLTATRLNTDLSGASSAAIIGSGTTLAGELSGASKLEAYDFPVTQADLDVSGASSAKIRVQDALTVKASGASTVRYRGTPRINSTLSGASTLSQE
ncbi:GIN domain-containing protein [Spirosoma validum]|nr:DUF2807 domain-containing protein [Spirosoma validum]